MKLIPLRKSTLSAEVDDADYEYLSQFNWFPQPSTHTCYAVRNIPRNGKWSRIQMHRELLEKEAGPLDVDHVDLDGLNNQRGNLRVCSRSWNIQRKRVAGEFRGVKHRRNRWESMIMVNGVRIFLGAFASRTEAARAYDVAALRHFGELAGLNFPVGS